MESLWGYYQETGRFSEGVELFETAATQHQPESLVTSIVQKIFARCAIMLCQLGYYYRAQDMSSEALKVFLLSNDISNQALCHLGVGMSMFFTGQLDDARTYIEKAFDKYKTTGSDLWGIGSCRYYQAEIARVEQSLQLSLDLHQRKLEICPTDTVISRCWASFCLA